MSLNGLIGISRLFCPALVLLSLPTVGSNLPTLASALKQIECAHWRKATIYGIYCQSIAVMCSYAPLLMSGYYLQALHMGLLGVIIPELPLITYMVYYYT